MFQYTPPKYRMLPVTAFSPKGWLDNEIRMLSEGPFGKLDLPEEFGALSHHL